MKPKVDILFLVPLIAIGLLFAAALPAQAQKSRDLAKVFESKPVTIIVGSAPGGGYDVFGRMVARFVGKYLPGNPSFIVQNIPGGGQLRGLRAAMKSTPDGLTVGLLHPRFVQRELAGIDVPDFDLKTVRVLGSPSATTVSRIWCVRRSIATNWDEIVKLGRPLTNGDTGPGASFGLGPQFVALIGGPVKMVYGYGGTSEIMAAFDRGETDSIDRCTEEHVPRLFPKWIENKVAAPIFWWEREPSKDWLGKLGVTKIPYIFDVVKAAQDQRSAFEMAVRFNTFSRTFVTPPGVPDDIYLAWKKAIEATTKDPGFLKAAEAAGLEVGLGTADDFNQLVDSFSKLSPAGAKVLKDLVGQGA
jgi:tripartite-type tricarboxylate transporter receptor subunit TctC